MWSVVETNTGRTATAAWSSCVVFLVRDTMAIRTLWLPLGRARLYPMSFRRNVFPNVVVQRPSPNLVNFSWLIYQSSVLIKGFLAI